VKRKTCKPIETIQGGKNTLGQGFPDLNFRVVEFPQQLHLIPDGIDALLFRASRRPSPDPFLLTSTLFFEQSICLELRSGGTAQWRPGERNHRRLAFVS
jgi:hypothetical protein